MAANKHAYRAVIGHRGILPGTEFASRMQAKKAGLTKEQQRGISWGLDEDDQRVADAIVLNKGYEDDHDTWDFVLYTGAGGRNAETERQEADQSWTYEDNEAVKRSFERKYFLRVLRGYKGESYLSPTAGYRYDGLYEIESCSDGVGHSGFRICKIALRRCNESMQELTSLEMQLHQVVDGEAPRRASTVMRVVRDTAVAQRVKKLHAHRCQVCRLALLVGVDGASYAEGAHIQALGAHGKGPDIDSNVLCLCPNCHVRFDRGAIYITDDLHVIDRYVEPAARQPTLLRTVEGHEIRRRFLRAHRRMWGVDGGGI
ncbi:YDG/SRA domain-containing protein [Streptomyces sp. NBC_00344]|uniref:YDG/SRA domain-containing protein n=1 Tax=Streptomyces sp. NBC_00344 TaxID=2975720 RepID=UPI002E2440BB